MPTEPKPSESATDKPETGEQQGQQQDKSTEETSGQDGQQAQSQQEQAKPATEDKPSTEEQKDPAKESLLKDLKDERTKRQSLQAEVETLKSQAGDANKATEALTALQTRYDRLEEFLLKAGGPLGKALDSRTFTKALFESDQAVAEIAEAWLKDNPSATSSALGSGAGAQSEKSASMSDLLRAAAR